MEMNIAALSVDMNLAQAQQNFGVAVMKMAMETSTEQTEEILQELDSLDPNLGQNIDIIA
ncbi:MAG: YjfB family protein [Selenomonadaceae bacterium]|nr:YjfB family protein [Selenomonadaceae bacterium]